MSNFRRVALLMGVLLAGQVEAARFVMSPVLLNLNPAQGLTTSTTVTNTDTDEAGFTAEVMAWTQQDGKDVLVPTRDAVVSPGSFTVAAGRSQVVRVALRQTPTSASVTYRLILRQKVTAAPSVAAGTTGATITPRYVFSLPLFVERPAAKPQVSVTLSPAGASRTLVLRNSGDGYGVFRNIRVTAGGQSFDLGAQYVLSGVTMQVPLPPEAQNAATLEFTATDRDQKPVRLTVDAK